MEGTKIKTELEFEFDPVKVENEAEIKIEQENSCQDPLAIEIQLLNDQNIKIESDSFNPELKAGAKKSSDLRNKDKTKKTCDICNKTFSSTHYLWKHYRDVHERITEKCSICNKEILKSNILRHKQLAHRPQKCGLCDTNFSDVDTLKKHIKEVHAIKTENKCDLCNVKFAKKGVLNRHLEYAHKDYEFKCQHCQKFFSTKQNRDIHISTVHLGIKKFKCDFCEKTFGYRTHLKDHLHRLHKGKSESNKYECNLCGKTLNNKLGLKRHQGGVHGMSHLLTNKCEICGKCFSDSTGLVNHKANIHGIGDAQYRKRTKSKSLMCKICDRFFDNFKRVENHKTKEHNVKCEHCEMLFVSKLNLNTHSQVVHNENLKKQFLRKKVQTAISR